MEDDSRGLDYRAPALWLLVSAATAGGAGLSTTLGPRIEAGALQACIDVSGQALDLSAANAGAIDRLDRRLDLSTRDRFTASDAAEMVEKWGRDVALLERELDLIRQRAEFHREAKARSPD